MQHARNRVSHLVAETSPVDPANLIREDVAAGLFRVHRSAMTSPRIMELEQKRIFGRSWLYVGHDSEWLVV